MKVLVLTAAAILISATAARPDAASGEMFGYQIGAVAEDFDRKDVWFEMLGWPWLERAPENTAEEFDRLQLLVTPYTGTIIGVRVIAEFEDLASADTFAQRMAAALSAKFGPSIYFHTWTSITGAGDCPYDDVRYVCTNLPRDMDLYRARIADFELSLHRYVAGEQPTVYLNFGVDASKKANNPLLKQLADEYQQYEKWSAQELLAREADGALRGID